MGKSALLRAVGESATELTGTRVLAASGVEFEAELAYVELRALPVEAPQSLVDQYARHRKDVIGKLEQLAATEPDRYASTVAHYKKLLIEIE